MKIVVINGSSQKNKNELIYASVKNTINNTDNEVVNFGIFKEEDVEYSYVEIAMMISILLESKAIDFVVTGCSSGQGMMLACNSLPGIVCGYIENPADAYLFGRINGGNAISIPLGLNFGWAAEINLQCILEKLFEDEFGIGYPKKDSKRKQRDTNLLKSINSITKRNLKEIIPKLDMDFMQKVIGRNNFFEYVVEYGQDDELIKLLKLYR